MQTTRNLIWVLTAVLMLFSAQVLDAQESKLLRQTLSSSGSSSNGIINGGSKLIQQSIGQSSMIGTYTSQNKIVRQGFIQPGTSTRTSKAPVELNALVYPNPFSESIYVQLNEALEGAAQISIYDLSGRLIENNQINASGLIILEKLNLENGFYLLKIQIGQKLKTFKIQKK